MLQQCHGYAAELLSSCYDPLYSASGVPLQSVDMPPDPLPHQSTWSILNWTLPKLIAHIFCHSFTSVMLSTCFTQFVHVCLCEKNSC